MHKELRCFGKAVICSVVLGLNDISIEGLIP